MGCYDFKDFDPIKVTTTHDTDISEWHLLQLVEKLMPVFIKKGSGEKSIPSLSLDPLL